MAKRIAVVQDLLAEAQGIIAEIKEKANSKPAPINLPELQIQLGGLIGKQLELGMELFEKYKIMPKFLYWPITPEKSVKIFTGLAGVDEEKKCANRFQFTEKQSICVDCVCKKKDYRILEVPHGFTEKASTWGADVPVHRYQCSSCGLWDGGYVLDRIVNAGL
jgi:hypothetical protein